VRVKIKTTKVKELKDVVVSAPFTQLTSHKYNTECCASMEVGQLASGKNATPPPGEDIIEPNQEG